jgi:hypothetical protein
VTRRHHELRPVGGAIAKAVRRMGGYDPAVTRSEEETMGENDELKQQAAEEQPGPAEEPVYDPAAAVGAAAGTAEGEDPPNAPNAQEVEELRESDVTREDQLNDREA